MCTIVPAKSRFPGPTISMAATSEINKCDIQDFLVHEKSLSFLLPMTYATRKTPDVVAPINILAKTKVMYSGAIAASKPPASWRTKEMKNVGLRPKRSDKSPKM